MVTASILLYTFILLGLLAIFMWRLRRSFIHFRVKKLYTAVITAPSVSVCIPARNEMHAMTDCLERVLASDYKKLEIIVFDDNSVDDTTVLIRSFAHAGVRFVPGDTLPDGWLGKNHALEVLAREASGTYIIFLDVDTLIAPTTISQLVGYITTEKMEMISVIPGRDDGWRLSVLFGHLRYFWELVRSSRNAPATASTLWMIQRETLIERFGGFSAVKANVSPEASLAATFSTRAYHCLVNNSTLGVSYEKKWQSQCETSRRLLYPMIGASRLKGLLALLLLVALNVPFFIVLTTLLIGWHTPQIVSFGLMVAFMMLYSTYTHHMWQKGWWLGGLLWPLVVLQELILLIMSILGYARHTITWKGRLVTAKSSIATSYVIDK